MAKVYMAKIYYGGKLASDLGAGGTSYASAAAIMASAHAAGTEWRSEAFAVNPYANLPVERIGVRFTDGIVVDYTVRVTDAAGSFTVWARNLDRAVQLEWKTGDSRGFNLRAYAIDFDALDEVNASDNSAYRVEMLTPAQFHFATSLGVSRRAAAANDNDNSAWRAAAFCWIDGWEMAA